jgi:hypothetical protein
MTYISSQASKRKKPLVNYVAHLNQWNTRVKGDSRLTAGHISLYYALFHVWNDRRFQNPINVYRDEMIQNSGVSTRNKYAQFLRELGEWGYIQYTPQDKSSLGSHIHMIAFDTTAGHPASHPAGIEIDTDYSTDDVTTASATPIYNINKIKDIKDINYVKTHNTTPDPFGFHLNPKSNNGYTTPPAENEPSGAGAGGGRRPKSLDAVIDFFRTVRGTSDNAKKFYLYHEANGWTMGRDHAPVVDWKARAEYWILSDPDKDKPMKPGELHIPADRDYQEPL